MIPERLKPLLEGIRPLAERFDAADFKLYLVGGVVRDLVLGRPLFQDLDFTTDARPEDTLRLVEGWAEARWTQRQRYGTTGFQKGGHRYEVTTHRGEAYRPDSRKPDVRFASAVEEDLGRRDFTVNAMALSIGVGGGVTARLIDPFGGAHARAARRLRTPLSPEESFNDDPLRMLRAGRCSAGYERVPTPERVAAVRELRGRLEIVSAERIRDELDKLLVTERPGRGPWFLVETGLADEFLSELPALGLEQDPIHRHKDVLAHTIAVIERTEPDRILRLAALFHDVGKPKTRSFGPEGVSFHHHEVVGARMTEERMRALRYSADDIAAVRRLVELRLPFHGYSDEWTDSAVRRYARDAGPLLARLNALTRADCTTRNKAKARMLAHRMHALESRIEELRAKEELDALRPDLDGRQVMEHLGVPPGPVVGEALRFLLELRIEEGPLGEEEAIKRLDEWWARRQDG